MELAYRDGRVTAITASLKIEEGFLHGTVYHYRGYGFFIPESHEPAPIYISEEKREKMSQPDSDVDLDPVWVKINDEVEPFIERKLRKEKVPENVAWAIRDKQRLEKGESSGSKNP